MAQFYVGVPVSGSWYYAGSLAWLRWERAIDQFTYDTCTLGCDKSKYLLSKALSSMQVVSSSVLKTKKNQNHADYHFHSRL